MEKWKNQIQTKLHELKEIPREQRRAIANPYGIYVNAYTKPNEAGDIQSSK